MYSRFNYSQLYRNSHIILDEDPSQNLGALWLGDFSAALDKKGLKEKNIKTVLTTASGLNVSYGGTIHHRIYQLNDVETANVARYFDDTFREIEQGLKNGSVLVHCAAGVSRSASCTIAYLMRQFNWSFINSFNFVKRKRKVICPNPGFVRQLRSFETSIKSNGGGGGSGIGGTAEKVNMSNSGNFARETYTNFGSGQKTEEMKMSNTYYSSSLNKTPSNQIQSSSSTSQQPQQLPNIQGREGGFSSSKGFTLEGNGYGENSSKQGVLLNKSSLKVHGGATGPGAGNFPSSSLGMRNNNQLNVAIQDLEDSLENSSHMYQSALNGKEKEKPTSSIGNKRFLLGQGGVTTYNEGTSSNVNGGKNVHFNNIKNNSNNSNNNNNNNLDNYGNNMNQLSIMGSGTRGLRENGGTQENKNGVAAKTLFPFSQNSAYGGHYNGSGYKGRDFNGPTAIQTPNIVTYNANSSLRTQSRGISENNAIQRNAKAVTTASLQNALGINNIYQRQYHKY